MQFFPYLCAMILRRCCICLFFLASCLGWQGCSRRALDEAQQVVAEADSLWHEGKMYGIDEGDSLSLAQAYETLGKYSAFYTFVHRTSSLGTYAHACYHYGRLLREKNDPVSAMQVFIDATHSRTDDLHILGRIYSNIGDICHLAGDYPLAYDMYERSGDMYLQNGDTLLYYYDLNNMAYELAEQGKEKETIDLISKIETCANKDILFITKETKARLYLKCRQYDSTLYYAQMLFSIDTTYSSASLLIAQAYSFMGIKDSATRYANIVLSQSQELFERNNALYILTNDDETRDKESIREVAAERSDTQKLIEIQKGKLSQAVQLLELDLNLKPDFRWVYAIIITTLCTGGAFYWRFRIRKRQMHSRIEKMIERQNDNVMQSIKQHIDVNDITQTLHWKNYAAMKVDADLYLGGIVSKLEKQDLNETEIRFCLLTMLDFSLKHIAETIHYGHPSGIKTLKKRISIKLGTTPPQLRDFLFQVASKT